VGIVADDQAGAGAEDRRSGRVQAADRRPQPRRLDQLADRRALAARNYQAVQALEIGRNPDLADSSAKLAQRTRVRLETALQR